MSCLEYHIYAGYDALKEGRRHCELGREACRCIESLQNGKQIDSCFQRRLKCSFVCKHMYLSWDSQKYLTK